MTDGACDVAPDPYRSSLADRRVGLSVHRYGDRRSPIVLLVHGVTEAGTAWPDLVARWGARFDIVAPDLRGHGTSPRFTDVQLTAAPETLLADIVGLLDALTEAHQQPVGVIGHSLGGLIALRAAVARPEAVAALVLEDPARPDGLTIPDPDFVAQQLAFLEGVTGDRSGWLAAMRRDTPWSDPELLAWAECKPLVDRDYIRRGLYLGGDPTWGAELRGLRAPTLLVVPDEAPMAPDRELTRAVPMSVQVVPGAGHCVRRDRPQEYHAAVDPFLHDLLPSARS